MVENGAQLVEVLTREAYEAEHLPRAITIPLQQLDRQTIAALQQDQDVPAHSADRSKWDALDPYGRLS